MKTLSETDREFVMQVRPTEIAEIKLSEIAEEFATRGEVKQLAHNLALEHANTDAQLMGIVDDANIELPDRMDPEHRRIEQRLLELDGDPFDREYLRVQKEDHERIISLFERELREGDDPVLTDFARRCLPLLQRHLRNVEDLSRSLHL